MDRLLIETGLVIQVPEGTYGRIAPRSGIALKHGIAVGGGVIDRDYRGTVNVLLFNHGTTAFQVKAGDRIAQLIIECIVTPEVAEISNIKDLGDSVRGSAGFGSTGVTTK